MATQYFKTLNGYFVKDSEARELANQAQRQILLKQKQKMHKQQQIQQIQQLMKQKMLRQLIQQK